jgi:hypothetical protein
MMPKPKITPEIKLQADTIVARFNVEQLRGMPWAHYVTSYRGAHLHLGHQQAEHGAGGRPPGDHHHFAFSWLGWRSYPSIRA